MSEKRCCDCEHFGLSQDPIFRLIAGICGRCGKEVGYTEKCLFEEEKNKGEKSDDYEVEVIIKDNKIIVMGKIRPIIQYENCKCYMNEDNNLGSEE